MYLSLRRTLHVTGMLINQEAAKQMPAVVKSVFGLVGLVSEYFDWMRYQADLLLLFQCDSM